MSSKEYKKVLFIMIAIGILAIPVLYMFSDRREQAVKEVENEFDLTLSKDVRRIKEVRKEPSFHGDGEAAILLYAKGDEIKSIEDKLSEYKVEKDSKEYEAIVTCINKLKERGFDDEMKSYDKFYFKQTTDYRYANFIAIITDEDNDKILYIKWDT